MYLGLTIISFAFFIAYLVYALVNIKEIPHSISQTYYRVPWKNGMGTTYQMMVISILPVILAISPVLWWSKLFAVFGMCCLWGITGAPDYWDEKQTKVHGALTWGCEIACGIFCLLNYQWWWVLPAFGVLFLIPCFILGQWKDCRSFWIELACFFSFYTITILNII